jgi:hypothetical protein
LYDFPSISFPVSREKVIISIVNLVDYQNAGFTLHGLQFLPARLDSDEVRTIGKAYGLEREI